MAGRGLLLGGSDGVGGSFVRRRISMNNRLLITWCNMAPKSGEPELCCDGATPAICLHKHAVRSETW